MAYVNLGNALLEDGDRAGCRGDVLRDSRVKSRLFELALRALALYRDAATTIRRSSIITGFRQPIVRSRRTSVRGRRSTCYCCSPRTAETSSRTRSSSPRRALVHARCRAINRGGITAAPRALQRHRRRRSVVRAAARRARYPPRVRRAVDQTIPTPCWRATGELRTVGRHPGRDRAAHDRLPRALVYGKKISPSAASRFRCSCVRRDITRQPFPVGGIGGRNSTRARDRCPGLELLAIE